MLIISYVGFLVKAMLCSLCEKVSKEIQKLLLRTSLEGERDIPDPENLKLHASSYAALQASANLGCSLCKLLVQCVSDQVGESQVLTLSPEHASLSYQVDWYRGYYDFRGRYWIESVTFYFGYSDNPLQISMYQYFFRVELIRLSACHQPSLIDINGRHIHPDPASDESILMIKDWVHECESLHPHCRRATTPTKLPTRVIDVGLPDGSREPHLLVTAGRVGQYAALSHVWGNFLPVRTTFQNLTDFLSILPLSLLPPSFRDAVFITRRLGLRYLWIDALCIIQDSITDWEEECARMGDVYKNSSITIAAVDAKNSQVGFLNERPSSVSNPPSCKLPCLISEECTGAHIEMAQREPTALLDEQSPLTFRAWCFQEKFMSLRTLYFGCQQTYWGCDTLAHIEAYGTASPENRTYQGMQGGQGAILRGKDSEFTHITTSSNTRNLRVLGVETGNDPHDKTEYSNYEKQDTKIGQYLRPGKGKELWNSIVLVYSSRALTDPKDKLPALSGIAHLIQEITGYTYLAGIWLEHLTELLCWTVKNPGEGNSPVNSTEYIAPSWSWASYHGTVYRRPFLGCLDITVLEAVTTAAGHDPFGRVTSGHLRIYGRLRRAVVPYGKREREDHAKYWTFNRPIEDLETNVEIGKCTIDNINFDKLNPAGKAVFCLALHRRVSSNYPSSCMEGLNEALVSRKEALRQICRTSVMILDKADWDSRRNAFKRIGLGDLEIAGPIDGTACQEWFADCDPQEIIIV